MLIDSPHINWENGNYAWQDYQIADKLGESSPVAVHKAEYTTLHRLVAPILGELNK